MEKLNTGLANVNETTAGMVYKVVCSMGATSAYT